VDKPDIEMNFQNRWNLQVSKAGLSFSSTGCNYRIAGTTTATEGVQQIKMSRVQSLFSTTLYFRPGLAQLLYLFVTYGVQHITKQPHM